MIEMAIMKQHLNKKLRLNNQFNTDYLDYFKAIENRLSILFSFIEKIDIMIIEIRCRK